MVVLSERSEPKDLSQMLNKRYIAPKLFTFTHFPKNTSANPLVSHTFKTKDLKPFRFTHFQKSGGGTPCFPPEACVCLLCFLYLLCLIYLLPRRPTSNLKLPTSALGC